MKATTVCSEALMLALLVCVPTVGAQQKDPRVNPPVTPVPAIGSEESSSKALPEEGSAAPQTKEQPPALSSVERFSVGGAPGRSLFLPSFYFYQGGDTNARSTSGTLTTTPRTVFGGQLTYQRVKPRSEFNLDYSGSETIYASRSELNSTHQALEIKQRFHWRRWTMLISDSADYSPDGTSGGGFGGPGSGLDPTVLPNQSVLTQRAPRISNTVVGEVELESGPRSSLTFSGSYGVLRFTEGNLTDHNTSTFRSGYNYSLTSRDTVAVSYSARLFRFGDSGESMDSHSFHLNYGRNLTGRLAFQIGAGPQITISDSAALGSSKSASWSLYTSLDYRLARADLSLSYGRGTSGGSGVLQGATTHQVDAMLNRKLSRQWKATLSFSYARNQQVPGMSSSSGGFQTFRGEVRLTRPWGRYASVYFSYDGQGQTPLGGSCTAGNCGLIGTRHMFGIGFSFRFRPIDME